MAGLLSTIKKWIYPARKKVNKIFSSELNSENMNTTSAVGSIHQFHIQGIDGKEIDLASFKGKKILVVNTASECGYTPQYKPLQELHEKYKDKLAVIGFPANNFGKQEPGTESEIMNFCERNYGVTFPLSKKIDVIGKHQHPVFQWLTKKELNGWNNRNPNWNFCKYLIDENGKLIRFFCHKMDPMDEQIISEIEKR
jgi:glutathione peroxidase